MIFYMLENAMIQKWKIHFNFYSIFLILEMFAINTHCNNRKSNFYFINNLVIPVFLLQFSLFPWWQNTILK